MVYDNNIFCTYECDPDKNTPCPKTGCIYNSSALYPCCHITSNEKYKWDGKKERRVKNRSSNDIIEIPEEESI